jgi:hypothetical protein
MSTLYEQDFVEWACRNAELLRAHRFDEVDIENVAEEIESLGRSDKRELRSCVEEIIEHLLKLHFSSDFERERNERGWRDSLSKQRWAIEDLLEDSPSLRHSLNPELLARCYRKAAGHLRCTDFAKLSVHPRECIFTWEEILNEPHDAEASRR